MSLNNSENLPSISEQRENLLKLNPDLLFWVYSLKNENAESLELDYLEDVLTCYPNQLENLKWLDENTDITIINLWSLRKWNTEVLSWENKEISNPVLLSNWVIEIVEAQNKNWEVKQHLISTLRDGWAADELQRTTTAGRNSWDNLNEDLEIEHIEESPFLWYDKDWNFALASINDTDETIKILEESINRFIERKYLKPKDKNYDFVKKNFERNFLWIKYDNLENILKDILKNKRICKYSSEPINEMSWLEKDMKDVSLKGSKWKYFVHFDKDNNTIEYRLLNKITWFENGFSPLSKRPSRLYLESENQYPRVPRIENAQDWYVPTVKYFSENIDTIIKNKIIK